MRLNAETAALLPGAVRRPDYDCASQAVGVVHLGIGAFHRAHQAAYADDAMSAGDRDWRITGVSLRSPQVRDAMAAQDGLYTVSERSADGERLRLVGSVSNVLAAPENPQAVIDALASPNVHVVTLTVTEKGYLRNAQGLLDTDHADLRSDLAASPPRTMYGFLQQGLLRRKASGLPGLSIVSCDNLAGNGVELAALFAQFLERGDSALARWTEHECSFPSTMVDRIVPATTPSDLDDVAASLGMRDEAAVVTEPFSQWIIEDKFVGRRPRWEVGGAQLVSDVSGYETAKLRVLNGAHSALAYLGLERGYHFVHQAISDVELATLVRSLMADAAESLSPGDGVNPVGYAIALMRRFDNPNMPHKLAQIAMDGSQKITQRWLPALRARGDEAAACSAHLEALAAWIRFVKGDGREIEDPMAADLRALWARAGKGQIATALFGPAGLFSRFWVAPESCLMRLAGLLD